MIIQKPTTLDAARLAYELNQLKGRLILEAQQNSNSYEIYFKLSNPEQILKYSVQRRYAFIGLTSEIPESVSSLIKPLSNYEISGALQLNADRIVALDLEKKDRLGRIQQARLILEIIPNHGNAVLIDQDSGVKWALRKIETGKYKLPSPLKKATALNFNRDKIILEIATLDDIKSHIYGLNDRDLLNLHLHTNSSVGEALDAITNYASHAITPGPAWVIFKDNAPGGFSLVSPLLNSNETSQEYESALIMYERYYSLATGQAEEENRLEPMLKINDRELLRERSKAKAIKNELENSSNAHLYKRYGELLNANIDIIPKGAKHIRLKDFEGDEFFEIELNPAKSASANAEEYFKKYKKAVSSVKVLTSRLESAEKRIIELENAKSSSGDDATQLEQNMVDLKLLSRSTFSKAKTIVGRRLPYKRFWSSTGWEILVGRTNKDNDELTFKIASKNDYWFHAWQAAGSHTVLKPPQNQAIPDKQTLLEAASLAAHFSKARNSSKVPVAFTQVKFVRKPKNFPPGKVLVEKEKQLMVKPANPDDYQRQEDE
jgi:predicted ribosome quality control (RQC) complex YloA/Tae2 family protein